jgi:hypothetical protein
MGIPSFLLMAIPPSSQLAFLMRITHSAQAKDLYHFYRLHFISIYTWMSCSRVIWVLSVGSRLRIRVVSEALLNGSNVSRARMVCR